MTDSRFTQNGRLALAFAFTCARKLSHSFVSSEHLLYGVVKSYTVSALLDENIREEAVLREIERISGSSPRAQGTIPPALSAEGAQVIEGAAEVAGLCGSVQIDPQHILLSLIKSKGSGAAILSRLGVNVEFLSSRLIGAQTQQYKKQKEVLKLTLQYGVDMTAQAEGGLFDPVIERAHETRRLIAVLLRRQKSNPVLIGEAGVGKTAVVEHLAKLIAANAVPQKLRGKRIISLDIASLISGTKYRGEFEERVRMIINEIKSAQNVILFIDEIHMLSGAGAAEGAIDAANILKPALSRSQLSLIGATTPPEYKKYIESDGALSRRFQTIDVCELSAEQSKKVLLTLRPKYETYHNIEILDEAVEAAVTLSKRHLPERFLPDKAIDLLDEAAAFAACEGKPKLGEDDICAVLSEITGIDAKKISENERERLSRLEEQLKARVIGQDRAVCALSKAVRRARALKRDERQPICSFLFCGQSGVGKTELARALTEALTGSEENLIRLDMSEYMERHTVARIIGSPPGYVGYGEGGFLCEKVRKNPSSMLLFDEVEKAHPDVLNLLLQILEEGCLTDSGGKTVSFKSNIVILTSNAGASDDSAKRAGFVSGGTTDTAAAVKKSFRPELLNRLDDVIVFEKLNEQALGAIARMRLLESAERLGHLMIELSWDDLAVLMLAKASGARDIRRMVMTQIEDVVLEKYFLGQASSFARVTAQGGRIKVICDLSELPPVSQVAGGN